MFFPSSWRYNLHVPDESATERLSRISTTPPEFWSRKDWMESRRLRAQRKQAIWRTSRQRRGDGIGSMYAARMYPEGPFWPRTPRYNPQWKTDAVLLRAGDAILQDLWEAGYAVTYGMDGKLWAKDPWTGQAVPVSWFL